jgi:hypothetical protein
MAAEQRPAYLKADMIKTGQRHAASLVVDESPLAEAIG